MPRRLAGVGLVLAFALVPAQAAHGRDNGGPAAPAAPTVPALPDEPYRAALGALGLDARDLRPDTDLVEVFGQDRFRLPTHRYLIGDARRVPGVVEALRAQALEAARSPSEAVLFACSRIGARVRRALVGDPLEDLAKEAAKPEALADAVIALRRAGGEGRADEAALRRSAALVPVPVAEAAALILLAERRFLEWHRRAFASIPEGERGALAPGMPIEAAAAAAEKVDFAALAAGAFDVALAAERALPVLRTATALLGDLRFSARTPFGEIAIEAGRVAMLGPGGPVSVVVDLEGDDEHRGGAAGIGGFALLIDVEGDDRYVAPGFAQGAGFFGIGVLWDLGGDDTYEAVQSAQGAGMFGAGVLADAAGNDRYRILTRGQGYGGVFGSGLLVDAAGDDEYVAIDGDGRAPSAQAPEHNASFAQGAAAGHRADFTDGRSFAGGFGMLVDGGGNDVYRAGVFAQGTAYWYGTGILADAGGDDRYEGVWYVQGGPVHFSVGVLHDEAGDDRYRASRQAAQGCGSDFSLGFLYDAGGDDAYEAGEFCLGAATAAGLGVFVDRGGADRYLVREGAATVLGRSRTLPNKPYDQRKWGRTLGVFLDLGGEEDAYPAPDLGRNGGVWTSREAGVPDDLNALGALGVGLDR